MVHKLDGMLTCEDGVVVVALYLVSLLSRGEDVGDVIHITQVVDVRNNGDLCDYLWWNPEWNVLCQW